AQPLTLDKFGLNRVLPERLPGRVEAFDVTDLENRVMPVSQGCQFGCLFQICRQRFFHKKVNSALEELTSDGMMMDGRDGDDGGIGKMQKRPIVHISLTTQPLRD